MVVGAALSAALAVLTTAPVTAAPLATRLPQVASQFCVDILSRKVPLPPTPDAEKVLFARYGLETGLPDAAMQALGRDISLISQATLASGDASDGAFSVALGGSAGETCRIIVYKAPLDGLFIQDVYYTMQSASHGWRKLPPPQQPGNALKLSLLKRDAESRPYLANLLAPTAPGPVALVINVAAIPSNVTLPEGY